MPDTMRGDFPQTPCSDCGEAELGEVHIKHWGRLVPPGVVGFFGSKCLEVRRREAKLGWPPRPLGTRLSDFPRYLTAVGGKRRFRTIWDIAEMLDSGVDNVEVEDEVLEADFTLRRITEEERYRLNDLRSLLS